MPTSTPVLAGQTALVTGASRGVGLAVAGALGRVGAGVALVARSHGEVRQAAADIGERAVGVSCDVTSPEALFSAVADIQERLGPLDLVVHSAGTADVIGPLWEADPEAWWEEVAGHLRGAMLVCRAALPGMLERGSGRVVLMYGNLGEGGDPYSTAYAAGKAGLLRLVEQLAAELEGSGVVVLGVHPGLVWTGMTEALATDPEKRRWLPRFADWPKERFGSGDAVADLIVRVAQGEADDLAGLVVGPWDELSAVVTAADQIRSENRRVLRVDW